MDELEKILRCHAKRYPLMEPTDAVKLIYQNEFGGGHLIKDPAAALEYLRREYEGVEKDPAAPLWEDIGNGIVRVHLAAVPEDALSRLGQAFLRSAAAYQGSLPRFREKFKVLCKLAEEGIFSFGSDELAAYLQQYEAAGYPAVSHSERYRNAYRPAYRVVQK